MVSFAALRSFFALPYSRVISSDHPLSLGRTDGAVGALLFELSEELLALGGLLGPLAGFPPVGGGQLLVQPMVVLSNSTASSSSFFNPTKPTKKTARSSLTSVPPTSSVLEERKTSFKFPTVVDSLVPRM